MLGGVLAAGLYDYLFCPNPELKERYAEALAKTSFPSAKYHEVLAAERDQLAAERTFTVMDVERAERKGREERERQREASSEVLSSV